MSNVYICTGSCHGAASQDQYNQGATTCGAKTCERFGKPLEPRLQCYDCEEIGPRQFCEECKVA